MWQDTSDERMSAWDRGNGHVGSFSDEFKRNAVELVRTSGSIAEIADS
jgi:transposase-like protein